MTVNEFLKQKSTYIATAKDVDTKSNLVEINKYMHKRPRDEKDVPPCQIIHVYKINIIFEK